MCAGQADEVVGILQKEGLENRLLQQHTASCLAFGSALALNPEALYQPCMRTLQQMLERGPHDALQPNEIKIFQTPEGQLPSLQCLEALGICLLEFWVARSEVSFRT